MRSFGIRWRNFRGFVDSGWLDVRPITIFIGSNNSGKTSLLVPLLLLKQTLTSPESSLGLLTRGELADVGGYREFVHGHDESRAVSFGLRFDDLPEWSPRSTKLKAPRSAEFTFTPGSGPRDILLQRYALFPAQGPRLVRRERLSSGGYSLPGFSKRPGRPWRDADAITGAIRRDLPKHFLFTDEAVLKATLTQALTRAGTAEAGADEVDVSLPERAVDYVAYVGAVARATVNLLAASTYIGPLRESPRRFYPISGDTPPNVGVRGEFAPELLFRAQSTSAATEVAELLKLFVESARFDFSRFEDKAFSLLLRRSGSPTVNIADTGFGISQILPLLVQAAAKESGILLTEQPEIHLNPRLQATLADLFVRLAHDGHSVIAETHSEHLIMRLRRLVAEGFPADQVRLYFVGRERGVSTVQRVPIDSDGHIDPKRWPAGFFEEAFREAVGLAEAQRDRSTNA